MPDLTQLHREFNEDWDWSNRGDEWSDWFGGTPALWSGTLLPRVHPFLPARTILEIAPGFGRCTQYLKEQCDRLILVDLSEKCIAACRDRFEGDSHIDYHVNDGLSLPMVDDKSVDFAFSWDSLIHADTDAIGGYINELSRTLAPNGVAFLHHSNAGRLARFHQLSMRFPKNLRDPLIRRGVLLDVNAWRSAAVSALDVRRICQNSGLDLISQELFVWRYGPYLTETISVMTPPGSSWSRSLQKRWNFRFRNEVERLAEVYSPDWSNG